MQDWNAEQYSRFLKERTQPSKDLASRIPTDGILSVFDLGCGPGNSTKVLMDRFPDAEVIGGDYSEKMLASAREKVPGTQFISFDAEKDFDDCKEQYDLVFSNACIQWVPDHPKLLKNMMEACRKGGRIAVQIPLQSRSPIHQVVRELVALPEWSDKIRETSFFYSLTPEEYFNVLAGLTDEFSIWECVYYHRMPSLPSMLEWYRGTGLRPFLSQLSEEDSKVFEAEILKRMKDIYKEESNGEIIFKFPRLFFTATRKD